MTKEDIGPTMVRDSFVMWSLQAGEDVFRVRDLLGHQESAAVKRFLRMSNEGMKNDTRKEKPRVIDDEPSCSEATWSLLRFHPPRKVGKLRSGLFFLLENKKSLMNRDESLDIAVTSNCTLLVESYTRRNKHVSYRRIL